MVYNRVARALFFHSNYFTKENNMRKKYNLPKELLEKELLVNRKTVTLLAKELNIKNYTIYRYLKKYNLFEKVKQTHPYHHSFKDLTNQKFGKLIAQERSTENKWGKPVWRCKCECGRFKKVPASSLTRGFTTSCTKCIKTRYAGYKEISKTYWTRVVNRAKEKSLDFNITQEFIWDLLEKQNFKCILSGVEINFHHTHKKQNASIDRIDSSKGYTKDNVQIIHKTLNKIKNTCTNEELLYWVKLIYRNNINDENN